jgi:hypothetical protein
LLTCSLKPTTGLYHGSYERFPCPYIVYKILFNITLSFTPRSPKLSLPFTFYERNFHAFVTPCVLRSEYMSSMRALQLCYVINKILCISYVQRHQASCCYFLSFRFKFSFRHVMKCPTFMFFLEYQVLQP